MDELLQSAINHSAELALLVLFLIVLAESTALVGLVVPGTVLMITMGTLIGTGKMDFWLACAVGFAAAFIGDVFSYALGFKYRRKLHRLKLIRQHRRLLLQARHVLRHHGPVGIFVGRFLGPTRPVLPMVAGMLSMPPRRFMPACILACLLWSPLYFLPGILAGAAIGLGQTDATHFPTLLMIAAALCATAIWTMYRCLKNGPRWQQLTALPIALQIATPVSAIASSLLVWQLLIHPHATTYGTRLWGVIS